MELTHVRLLVTDMAATHRIHRHALELRTTWGGRRPGRVRER